MKRTAAFHQSLQKRPHDHPDIANYLMLSAVTLNGATKEEEINKHSELNALYDL
ncbi:MAG: hypothetical protein IMF19_08770 [Proteobacteria bacterium]|nr:hypothetical protein [Pseudomonadota bacterium]